MTRKEGKRQSVLTKAEVSKVTEYLDKFAKGLGNVELVLREDVVFPATSGESAANNVHLPHTLTGKERKLVHDLCSQSNIYHISVGERDSMTNPRRMVLSRNGSFEGVATASSLSNSTFRLRGFKPFAFSKEGGGLETGVSKDLRDNPGRCVRDIHDRFDFASMKETDLGSLERVKEEDVVYVDSLEKLRECGRYLREGGFGEIGFDLEMYNWSPFELGMVCLMQLSSGEKNFVIDVLADVEVWQGLREELGWIFADPSVVKIGHGISFDVKALSRDFGIVVVNAFDTHEAAKVLGLERVGLAHVCAEYGLPEGEEYKELKGKWQSSDWRVRPLDKDQILYGVMDVHYLVLLRVLMVRDLSREIWAMEGDAGERGVGEEVFKDALERHESVGDMKPARLRWSNSLMKVLKLSQARCLNIYDGSKRGSRSGSDVAKAVNSVKRGDENMIWKPRHDVLLKAMLKWRREAGEKLEVDEGSVCGTEYLVKIVRAVVLKQFTEKPRGGGE
ncbi:hypothetical protein TrRE_jg1302 [Triparma retinervis]|uniref:3'-5' exonuclease domain-containing protein n=1 Tax=Triparma retinervis TaxID=2557542 RepID=A0A9W7E3J2_9STRA|nr:hypothetical protein TrRE_jg1302 [Triparma retinervis]